MDVQELSDLYMEKFNGLSSAFSRQAILHHIRQGRENMKVRPLNTRMKIQAWDYTLPYIFIVLSND